MKYQYDLVIIGGGSGGLVAASSTAQMGLKVILIEKDRLGGDCLWHGCVPSKAIIASARRAHEVANSHELGLPKTTHTPIKLESVIARLKYVQKKIEPHDSPERFRSLGAEVLFGESHFLDSHTLMVGSRKISFKYAIISTGSRPKIPNIPGLEEAGYLTNVEVFSIKKLPKKLVVIGGGPIGVELGQAFARLGSQVTIIARSGILQKEDSDLTKKLENSFEAEDISVVKGYSIIKVQPGKTKKVFLQKSKSEKILECDEILVAVGRTPNLEGLQLEQAGIDYDKNRIITDDYLRTSRKNIFAIGDVNGKFQFTHVAASQATTAVRNMISPIKSKAETTVVPWVTYADPELARVGMIESEARAEKVKYEVLEYDMSEVDRALTEGNTKGKIKVIISPKGEILGASILGHNAGEMIMEYVLAMKNGLKIQHIAGAIHPYPTLAGANWTLAGRYYKKFLTPINKKISRFLFRL